MRCEGVSIVKDPVVLLDLFKISTFFSTQLHPTYSGKFKNYYLAPQKSQKDKKIDVITFFDSLFSIHRPKSEIT